jgi:hypothetical protein
MKVCFRLALSPFWPAPLCVLALPPTVGTTCKYVRKVVTQSEEVAGGISPCMGGGSISLEREQAAGTLLMGLLCSELPYSSSYYCR